MNSDIFDHNTPVGTPDTSATQSRYESSISMNLDTPSKGCPTCLYFSEIPGSNYGTCHRYPSGIVVAQDYWCGEWSSIHKAFVSRDTK